MPQAETARAQVKDRSASLAFDPSDPAFVANPYPRYAELREDDHLHPSEDGLWFISRHADVLAILRDTRMSSDARHATDGRRRRGGASSLFGDSTPPVMLFLDPPDHTRLRRLANKAFTPRAVEALRPRIESILAELLDRAAERGEMDLMNDLAYPLPVAVICEMLGVPTADQEQFKDWSSDMTRMLDPVVDDTAIQKAMPAALQFIQYFSGLIEERRANPRDDLLSSLIAVEAEGERLTQAELFAMCMLLFIAGHETTTNLIGNGTLALLRNRDQFDALRQEPGLAGPATEELLRYDPPVQVTARTATEDLEINGIPLTEGESVVLGLAAAGRDRRVWDEPDRVILKRGQPTHLAFSNGIHYCLGAPLARVEGQIAFVELTRRFPDIELRVDDPPYREHFVLRGLAELPVAL